MQRSESHEQGVREWRINRGLSQAQLADATGLTQPSLSNYETGKRALTLAAAVRIAAALEITVGDIADEPQVSSEGGQYFRERSSAVGQCVRDWRRQRGLSQAQLAHRSGLNQTALSNLEAGKRELQLESALRLAAALEITISDLTTDPRPAALVGLASEREPAAVGRRVREWRLKRGLSQAELAHLSGMNQASLSNYEAGRRELSLASALRVAAALDVILGDLIFAEDVIMLSDSRLGRAFVAVVEASVSRSER